MCDADMNGLHCSMRGEQTRADAKLNCLRNIWEAARSPGECPHVGASSTAILR